MPRSEMMPLLGKQWSPDRQAESSRCGMLHCSADLQSKGTAEIVHEMEVCMEYLHVCAKCCRTSCGLGSAAQMLCTSLHST
jgi:hypothetical protein